MELIVEDSIGCLRHGVDLLAGIPAEALVYKTSDTLNASVGAHFRHNIDHYRCFLAGVRDGRIDYDARARDPKLENDPRFAAESLGSIVDELKALPADLLDVPLQVKMDSGAETEPWSRSTARRELQFLLSHTVHHYALIAIICRMQGIDTPDNFGVAPSTIKHREQATAACAH